MKTLAKLLYFFSLALPFNAQAECLSNNPQEDYALLYSHSSKEIKTWFLQEVNLGMGAPHAKFIADEQSCGSQGCEYAVYLEIRPGCVIRAMDFVGNFTLGESTGMLQIKPIIVQQKIQGEAKSMSCIYRFNLELKQYEKDSENSCHTREPATLNTGSKGTRSNKK